MPSPVARPSAKPATQAATAASAHQPRFRSGAVARMAGMPVATLRVWEQRYQVVGPAMAASGHRLYSPADVERIALLRQLTENGHAIGSLAPLGLDELRLLAPGTAPVQPAEGRTAGSVPVQARPLPTGPLRVVVVGAALAARLRRLSPHPSGPPVLVVAVFDSLEAAAAAPAPAQGDAVHLLLWQAPSLHDPLSAALQAARTVWAPQEVAVVYRFARPDAREALLREGAWVVREPADDAALSSWLSAWRASHPDHGPHPGLSSADSKVGFDASGGGTSAATNPWLPPALARPDQPAPAPRFNDAALTRFGSLSSGIACECPSHVAELLLQITSFETYSAECANRSPADAELHAHLHRVAGAARVLLEGALVKVAEAEGWPLT